MITICIVCFMMSHRRKAGRLRKACRCSRMEPFLFCMCVDHVYCEYMYCVFHDNHMYCLFHDYLFQERKAKAKQLTRVSSSRT